METNINIAKFWTRVWAFLIDNVIFGAIGFLLTISIEDFLVSIGNYGLLLGLLIVSTYLTILNSKIGNGQTIGMRIMNIQVVDINGDTIGLSRSFLRASILSFPYFLVGVSIPGISEIAVLQIILTIIYCSFILGVVVIYIFNKQTRQSLHDLLTGTYVASTESFDEPQILPSISKNPFYILGAFILLFIGFTIYAGSWTSKLNNELSIHAQVSRIEGVINALITNTSTYSMDDKIKSIDIVVWVQNIPNDNFEENPIVLKVAQTTLENITDIDSYDMISIKMTREINIGIARKNTSKSIYQSPSKWRAILE